MAYDSALRKTIVFRGESINSELSNDTWEWDGTEWTQIANTGPSPRYFHSMVYDSSNKEILLFGGGDQTGFFADTWKMKHSIWHKAQDFGPGPLAGADMVFTGSRAILFGGYRVVNNQNVINHDAWDWKGSLWSTGGWHHNIVPARRLFHSLAYDHHRNCTVLFGGFDGSFALNDTWELTITQ